ncbi:MAG: hypothetical protein JKY07_04230 [SAR324 cluster bacterium]|nr:hypothetical protein [SAR324 cluster bacterium]
MSQRKIFMAPMASGGGLTDLILRCLVFWFGFRCSSFEGGISMAFDGIIAFNEKCYLG